MAATGARVAARIIDVSQETPTVKALRLQLLAPFTFQPGQWVDFHIPGIKQIGGYSICSTPAQLTKTGGTVDLAVKASRHPPAQWIHNHAARGDTVEVSTGGSFVLRADSCSALFVAGGIGITALASMLGHLVEAHSAESAHCSERTDDQGAGSARSQGRALLLYSARSPGEFALLPRLLEWQQRSLGRLHLQLHTTQQHGLPAVLEACEPPRAGVTLVPRRISKADLDAAVLQLSSGGSGDAGAPALRAYVCGPPAMTDAIVAQLAAAGVTDERMHTERWW